MATVINKKARYDYFTLDKFEAGIVLTGAEVKSIKEGSASLTDSYVRIAEGVPLLVNAYISPYKAAIDPSYQPRRERKLLLHKKEVDFFVSINNKPWFAVEAKLNDTVPSPNLFYFKERLNIPFTFQVIKKSDTDVMKNDIRVISADKFLTGLV